MILTKNNLQTVPALDSTFYKHNTKIIISKKLTNKSIKQVYYPIEFDGDRTIFGVIVEGNDIRVDYLDIFHEDDLIFRQYGSHLEIEDLVNVLTLADLLESAQKINA